MKYIKQGTIYEFNLLIEVPDDFIEDDIINQNTLRKCVDDEKKLAVEQAQMLGWYTEL